MKQRDSIMLVLLGAAPARYHSPIMTNSLTSVPPGEKGDGDGVFL